MTNYKFVFPLSLCVYVHYFVLSAIPPPLPVLQQSSSSQSKLQLNQQSLSQSKLQLVNQQSSSQSQSLLNYQPSSPISLSQFQSQLINEQSSSSQPQSLYQPSSSSSPLIVTLSSSPCKSIEFWIKDLQLYPSDKKILLSKNEWLNDSIINASQTVLKQLTAGQMKGYQNTQLGKKLQFIPLDENDKFVQILHVQASHWITVSNIYCKKNEVVIYDSLFMGLSLRTKLQICSIVKMFDLSSIKFLISNMQQQNDSSSCGLFAIAAATELTHGLDPTFCCWHIPAMRDHLFNCLELNQMLTFPKIDHNSKKIKRYIRIVEEEIYCKCHEVNDVKKGMVKCRCCSSWYHLQCVGLDEDACIPKIWNCERCFC